MLRFAVFLLGLLSVAAATETFDYIVVGAGTAGSIVAGRLALAGYRTLLLEAGPPVQSVSGNPNAVFPNIARKHGSGGLAKNLTIYDVPLDWIEILSNPTYRKESMWELLDHPKPTAAKAIGGCSTNNAMIYMRAMREDLESWGKKWNYDAVLPFYLASENNTDPRFADSPAHSTQGALQVTTIEPGLDTIAPLFIKACINDGMKYIEDFNDGKTDRLGAGYYQFNIWNGIRDSPAAAFFGSDIRKRHGDRWADHIENYLTVRPYSHVTRVLFDQKSEKVPPRAWAVEYVSEHDKQRYGASAPRQVARARKEIVLSAGAIFSPHILMLSGIGPAKNLVAFNITVVKDLPGVGKRYMDGAATSMQWAAPSVHFNRCLPDTPGAECERARKLYDRARMGLYAMPGFSAGAFFRSRPESITPDVQFTVHPWDAYQRYEQLHWDPSEDGVITLEIALNNPRSMGSVSLRSPNPFVPPKIDMASLKDPEDLQPLLWGIRRARQLFKVSPLREIVTKELAPGEDLDTDEELIDYILCGPRPAGDTKYCNIDARVVNHQGGTCKMAVDDAADPEAVVDSSLRVLGVRGLRVADASIFPSLPSANTHATVMMIGERAAKFLIDDAPLWRDEEDDSRPSPPPSASPSPAKPSKSIPAVDSAARKRWTDVIRWTALGLGVIVLGVVAYAFACRREETDYESIEDEEAGLRQNGSSSKAAIMAAAAAARQKRNGRRVPGRRRRSQGGYGSYYDDGEEEDEEESDEEVHATPSGNLNDYGSRGSYKHKKRRGSSASNAAERKRLLSSNSPGRGSRRPSAAEEREREAMKETLLAEREAERAAAMGGDVATPGLGSERRLLFSPSLSESELALPSSNHASNSDAHAAAAGVMPRPSQRCDH